MRWAILFLSLCVAACSTPQWSNTDQRGISEIPLASDAYRISVTGNAFTGRSQMNEKSLLRAAELADLNGYRHFLVMDPDTYAASVAANPSQNGVAGVYNAPRTVAVIKPGIDVIVKFVPDEYAAQTSALSVAKIYGLYGKQAAASAPTPNASLAASQPSAAPVQPLYGTSAVSAPISPAPRPAVAAPTSPPVQPAPAASTAALTVPPSQALPPPTLAVAPALVQAAPPPVPAPAANPANNAHHCIQINRELDETVWFENVCEHSVFIAHCVDQARADSCGSRPNRYFTQLTVLDGGKKKRAYSWDVSGLLRYHACKSPQHTDLGDGVVACR